MPFEYRTSKSSLFRCFHYSDVRYSDPHCTGDIRPFFRSVLSCSFFQFEDFCFLYFRYGKPGPLTTGNATTRRWRNGRPTEAKRPWTTPPKRPKRPKEPQRRQPQVVRRPQHPGLKPQSRSQPLRQLTRPLRPRLVELEVTSRAKSLSRIRTPVKEKVIFQ